jgi:hypothetical protein
MKKIWWASAPAVAALLLAGCTVTAAPAPAPTVTKPGPTVTREPEPAPTVTVTASADRCRDALHDDQEVSSIRADAITLASQGFNAAADGDGDELDRITRKVNRLSPKLQKAIDKAAASAELCEDGI